MSVSDLTNTTWLLNSTISKVPSGMTWNELDDADESYNINFTSNNTDYTSIDFQGPAMMPGGIKYIYPNIDWRTTQVYNPGNATWKSQEYRTITITGGSAVTNSTLISWLESNATQQVEPSSSTTNKIGDLSIIKKHFGDLEVIKEVLNGATIYEATTPTPVTYPSKSDIISLDIDGNGNKNYRVLKNVSGTIYELVGMYTLQAQFNTSGSSVEFLNSNLDTYLNTTWYGTLNETAKDAIVTAEYDQTRYEVKSSSTTPTSDSNFSRGWYYYHSDNGLTSPSYKWCKVAEPGVWGTSGKFNRKIYALDVWKIIQYFNTPESVANSNTNFNYKNIYVMLKGGTFIYDGTFSVPFTNTVYSGRLGQIATDGTLGSSSSSYLSNTTNAKWYPVFQIDLSKITFTINS